MFTDGLQAPAATTERSTRTALRPKRSGIDVQDVRDKFRHAQRVFDEYRAARAASREDADHAWAKLVQDAALALPRPLALPAGPVSSLVPAPPARHPEPARGVAVPAHGGEPPEPAPSVAPSGPATETPGAAAASKTADITDPPPSGVPPRPPRRFVAVVLVAIVASLSAAGMAHMKMRGQGDAERALRLSGTPFEGTIVPANQFTIAAPAATVVHRVLVSVGERVTAGQPLLVADDREARAALEAAELDLKGAETRVADVRQRLALFRQIPAADFARASGRVSTAQRESEQVPTRQWRDSPERAAAAHELARLRLDRVRRLADQGLVARQELEDAEISLRVASNDLENARRAEQAVATLTSAQTEQSDLQWKLARAEQAQQRDAQRAELALAELRRDDAAIKLKAAAGRLAAATVKASGPGVVTELLAHPGDQVYGGAPLVRLAVLNPLLVEVQVAPGLINALRRGQAAAVTLPGMEAGQVGGSIAAVSPIPNRNGNHTVQVRFENPDGQLLAGQPAEVRFVLP
jgi:membrane fusion protein (multidrug efflux system)